MTRTIPRAPMRLTTLARAAALVAAGLATHALALAQSAAPAPEEGLQTVVVTAQKRLQSMQNVPVAVNTVDARAIENQQILDFSDITRVAPSMTLNQNPGNNTISLRGIGTFAYSIGIESAVSVIVDDVPVIQQMQAFSNLSDIDRIEVLRGPQGTLFGKNSSAGVINVVTKASADTLEGSAQVTLTSDGEHRVEGSISGPLSPAAGFRLNVFANQRDGEITNLTTGRDLNGDRGKGIRARLDLKPSADLTAKLIADYSTRHVEGPVTTMRAVPPGSRQQGVAPLEPALAGITPGPENRTVRMDSPGYNDSENASLSANIGWKLANHTLTSVTTYQDWRYSLLADFDFSSVDLVGALTNNARHGGVSFTSPYRSHMFTQELRLSSNGDGVFNYLGGLYYSNSDNDRSFDRGPVLSVARWDANAGNRTLAAFAQADYKLTDTTRINAGLRYNREKIDVDFTNLVPATPVRYQGNSSDNAATGKLALQHDLAKAVMVYASYATGYKGAGYDISTGFDQSRVRLPVAPETSKAYELGLKSRFLQNRVQLNATAFQTDYDDFQAQSSRVDPTTNVRQNAVTNVGALRTKGVELELTAKPINTLMIESSLAYVDAKIRRMPTALCYPGQTVEQGCVRVGTAQVQDLAGKRLSNAPKVKFTLGGTYNFAVGDSGYSGIANLNYQHQSAVNFDLAVNPLTEQRAYGILNGSIALSNPDHSWKVTLFVNNLLDKSYSSFIGDNYNFYNGSHVLMQFLPRNSERYAGVRAKYEF
jgi:iron complex outermembrane receptor protein